MPFMCYDIVFKALFIDEVNILVKIVSDITGMDYEILENNVTLDTNELPVNSLKEKAKRCDFILRLDENKIINPEINVLVAETSPIIATHAGNGAYAILYYLE